MENNFFAKSDKHNKNSMMLLVENNCKKDIENYLSKFPPGINDDIKSNAFLYACRIENLEIAKILLEYVTPNCRYSDGQTALMLISQLNMSIRGIMDFMDLLIIKGCEVNLVDFCGKSALHWATIKNSIWAVRALISYKCNINCFDLHGFTPLIYAAKLNFSLIVSLLLHSGADPTKSSKQQGTAIHQAVRCRSGAALKQLIPFYRNLNIVDSRNQCPIDLAVLFNNLEIVSILLNSNKEIEVNRRPSFAPFRTPLEEACQKNNLEIAKALIVAGADVNYPLEFAFELEKQNGRSMPVAALMFAVRHQNIDLVTLLLSSGADVSVRCPKAPGHVTMVTPMTLAAELGDRTVTGILEGAMTTVVPLTDVGDLFTAACLNLDVDLVADLTKKHNIHFGVFVLKNGAPVILELFRDSMDSNVPNERLLDFFATVKEKICEILNPEIATVLSKKIFGTSMQFYRRAWLKLAEQFPSHLMVISAAVNNCFVGFIISFLECLFFKKKMEDAKLLNLNLELLDCFNPRLVRWAVHSSNVIKSILLSKSPHVLAFLVDAHFNENIAFWDQNYSKMVDVCELALFFDNVDAALVLNLSCGLSLRCINEYDTLPYVPEVMNRYLAYNDVDKIGALKYLSKNVKPLKTLCKFAIRKYVPYRSQYDQLRGLSAPVVCDLMTDLSALICDVDVGLYPLCKWASVDPKVLNVCDF